MDGPAPDVGLSARELARDIMLVLVMQAALSHADDGEPGGVRPDLDIVSLVEEPGAELGYALAISSQPDFLDTHEWSDMASAVFFVIDRGEHPEVVDEPKRIDGGRLDSAKDVADTSARIIECFEREELVKIIFMLGKVAVLPKHIQDDNHIDGKVKRALQESYLKELAEIFPSGNDRKENPQSAAGASYDDPDFLLELAARLPYDAQGNTLTIEAEVDDREYALHIDNLGDTIVSIELVTLGAEPFVAEYRNYEDFGGRDDEEIDVNDRERERELQENFPPAETLIAILRQGKPITESDFRNQYNEISSRN